MNKTIDSYIAALADYAIENGLAESDDRAYLINNLLGVFDLHEFTEPEEKLDLSLEELLAALLDYAVENGYLEDNSVVRRDLLDTELMGRLIPRPSEVNRKFFSLYESSPKDATDWFYRFCLACDYIREYRIKKDVKWVAPSAYGDIDVTINLSKPEKDPKIIAALKLQKQSGYPLCNLCHENEGYAGSLIFFRIRIIIKRILD